MKQNIKCLVQKTMASLSAHNRLTEDISNHLSSLALLIIEIHIQHLI